ncbi:MAG TPA: DUF1844 domain-containing protein [Tepidisphaeraceae bacterium]|nr:DUF1844 domain-containing protein [Tepidisphaeraceae bacterium]
MAEEQPSLHIDTDWKKQAQEEKRRLAEQAAKNKPPATPPEAPATSPSSAGGAMPVDPRAAAAGSPAGGATRRGRGQRELPAPGFASLVQSVMTQVLYYLGDLASSAGAMGVDLDMAKYQLDQLTMLEDKTKGNLSDDECRLLDAALYETRSRFIGVASQFLGP